MRSGRRAFGGIAALGSFESDAARAMKAAPDYFVWWYTLKSVGLGVVAAAGAYAYGKAAGRAEERRDGHPKC